MTDTTTTSDRADAGVARPAIIDADGHIVETDDTFAAVPEEFRDYIPRPENTEGGFRYVSGDRKGFTIAAHPDTVGAPGATIGTDDPLGEPLVARGGSDPAGRLLDLDVDGISIAALYPTYGLMIQGVTDDAAATALCRSLNDWLADYCRHDPARLLPVATLPMTTPEAAFAEAERCLGLGFVGAWRRPERFDGVAALHDPGHDRLFSLLAEADRPLAIHPGLNGVVPYEYFGERFDEDYSAMHAAHFPVEQMMNLTALVAFGVLDRHPTLRVGLLETGATWLPFYAHRLDEHLETFGFPVEMSTKPSEQIRRQVYVSVEEAEPGLGTMLETYGDTVVFASDYPHGDGTFPGSTDELLEADELDDAVRNRIFWDNARRFYGLDTAR
jgi:predicted TIM-barrel fold metal-dependent hydrolase